MLEEKPVFVAVIGNDGEVEYRKVENQKAPAADAKQGEVVFPFCGTAVHSNPWKASEHIKLVERRRDARAKR